jgi:hypothetical protein
MENDRLEPTRRRGRRRRKTTGSLDRGLGSAMGRAGGKQPNFTIARERLPSTENDRFARRDGWDRLRGKTPALARRSGRDRRRWKTPVFAQRRGWNGLRWKTTASLKREVLIGKSQYGRSNWQRQRGIACTECQNSTDSQIEFAHRETPARRRKSLNRDRAHRIAASDRTHGFTSHQRCRSATPRDRFSAPSSRNRHRAYAGLCLAYRRAAPAIQQRQIR